MTLLTTDDQLITLCQIMLQKKLQSTIFSVIIAAQRKVRIESKKIRSFGMQETSQCKKDLKNLMFPMVVAVL